MSQKSKMCKSPKSMVYSQSDKIEYENMNTNCTIVGSNNLHLVKKPQIVAGVSPAYSNPSPGYPQSPYAGSPASLKSPSPQHTMKPPTPQPNTFPVMQIIHNSPVIARPIHHAAQQQNVIKIKPPLNILPKPSASPQQSPKPSVSPQIVLPTNQQATIMPTAQPLVLNQMPMLAPGVQFILRPQTAKLQQQTVQTPQGLILQQGGQQLLQLQPPRSQPMVRVLTNGVGLPSTTYVAQMTPQNNVQTTPAPQSTPPKKKPSGGGKKKKQKLDLANIMKLSGITGEDDDVQFESDTSQSESEHNMHSQPATPQPPPTTPTILQQQQPQAAQVVQQQQAGMMDAKQQAATAKVGNIQISAVPQTINAPSGTPLVQVLNQAFQGAAQPTHQPQQASIPFNPFITPNFTINNGLMVQRSGGFKLALGEDGRLVLQHDPTLNQDLNSQLLLQSIFGLNGGLVLQPSIDQIHSQTVQTIQQQSVQTIQSQTIQTVQHQIVQPQSIQSIQSQIQSLLQQQNLAMQPMHTQNIAIHSQPQPISGIHTQPITIHSQSQPISGIHTQPITIHSQSPMVSGIHSQPITIHSQSQPMQLSGIHTNPISINSQAICHPQPISINSQAICHPQPISINSQAICHPQPISINSQPMISHPQPITMHSQPTTMSTMHPQPINLPVTMQSTSQSQIINQVFSSGNSGVNQQNYIQQQLPKQLSLPQVQTASAQSQTNNQSITTSTSSSLGTQPVLKVQPFQKSQPPVQTVHPIHHHHNNQQVQQPQQPPPTSYVVNLTPDQLEQLKRNGQLTVNGQTIFMQRPKSGGGDEVKKTPSPKIKPIKKVAKVSTTASVVKEVKAVNNLDKTINSVVKEAVKAMPAIQKIPPVAQVSVQTQVTTPKSQPSAIIQPSIQPQQQQPQIIQPKIQPPPLPQLHPQPVPKPVEPTPLPPPPAPIIPKVERFFNHSIEDPPPPPPPAPPQTTIPPTIPTTTPTNTNTNPPPAAPTQRVHTIQLTPEKQQHLKSIQLQMQTLSARLTPGNTEMQKALKLLFQEQQKILATGKLIPPDKVFYHNNQLIVNNSVVKSEVLSPPPRMSVVSTVTPSTQPTETQPVTTSTAPTQPTMPIQPMPVQPKISMPTISNEVPIPPPPPVSIPQPKISVTPLTPVTTATTTVATVTTSAQSQPPPPTKFIPLYTKAQLIEQQLNTDQNGAIKPDIHTPFRDKADACKRLIRYHCFDQPVLSEKDLDKADEIFELTARHFIEKFDKMVDKYRYLLLKESQRHVQTSELMMLDRMFLSEEQQSLIKLRQEIEEANLEMQQQAAMQQQQQAMSEAEPVQQQQNSSLDDDEEDEEYDEWACIQRELGCLPLNEEMKKPPASSVASSSSSTTIISTSVQSVNKRPLCMTDTRLETLKKFRVDKHCKKVEGESSVQTHYVQSNNVYTSNASNSAVGSNYANGLVEASGPFGRTSCAMSVLTNRMIPTSTRTNSVSISSESSSNNTSHTHTVHSYNTMHVQHQRPMPGRNVQQYNAHHHIVQHITHTTVHHGSAGSVHSQNSCYSSGNEELDNNDSIDEQVQSAIDSILNLQQNTSLELDETVQNMLS